MLIRTWRSRREFLARMPASVGYPSTPAQLVRAAPFVLLCLVVSWLLMAITTKPDFGHESRLVFHIPDLTRDIQTGLSSVFTAPLINRGPQQVIYVTLLLLIFGVLVESREGSLRAMFLFYTATAAGAFSAAIALHVVYPGFIDHPALAEAWSSAWSGGSAAAFGFAGAFAARRQHAWRWLALFILWETAVATLHLRNYTPAFHFSALATGFLIARYFLPERDAGAIRASSPA